MSEEKKFNEWKAGLKSKSLRELETELSYAQFSSGYPRMGLERECAELGREIRDRKDAEWRERRTP